MALYQSMNLILHLKSLKERNRIRLGMDDHKKDDLFNNKFETLGLGVQLNAKKVLAPLQRSSKNSID